MAIRSRGKAVLRRRINGNTISAETREAILIAAQHEFAAHGFGGARAEAIARRAGVNKALPFYHFGSKAELYAEVLHRILDQLTGLMTRSIVASPSFEERLQFFAREFLAHLAESPSWLKIVVRELIDEDSRAKGIARRYLRPMVDAGRAQLGKVITDGTLREMDPLQIMVSVAAEIVFYALAAPFLEGLGVHEPMGETHRAAREQAVVQILTKGVLRDK